MKPFFMDFIQVQETLSQEIFSPSGYLYPKDASFA